MTKRWVTDFIARREYTAQTAEDRISVAIMRGELKLAKHLYDEDAGRRAYELEQWKIAE